MKKLVSVLLVLALCMTCLTTFAFADDTEKEVFVGKGGVATYSEKNDERVLTIVVDLPEINVVASYNNQPGKFYSERYSADSITSFNITNSAGVINWTGLVNFAETALSQATPKIIRQYVSERSTYGINRSSSGDIIRFVRNKYGEAYNDELLQIDSSYSGLAMRVYETMEVQNVNMMTNVLDEEMMISQYLTGILGLVVKSHWVSAVATALGLVDVSSSMTPKETKIAHFVAEINWFRYVTINGSSYMYNFTEKIYKHHAFEDMNIEDSLVIASTPETWYSHSSSYFNSYSRQTSDAYDVYCEIGQKA